MFGLVIVFLAVFGFHSALATLRIEYLGYYTLSDEYDTLEPEWLHPLRVQIPRQPAPFYSFIASRIWAGVGREPKTRQQCIVKQLFERVENVKEAAEQLRDEVMDVLFRRQQPPDRHVIIKLQHRINNLAYPFRAHTVYPYLMDGWLKQYIFPGGRMWLEFSPDSGVRYDALVPSLDEGFLQNVLVTLQHTYSRTNITVNGRRVVIPNPFGLGPDFYLAISRRFACSPTDFHRNFVQAFSAKEHLPTAENWALQNAGRIVCLSRWYVDLLHLNPEGGFRGIVRLRIPNKMQFGVGIYHSITMLAAEAGFSVQAYNGDRKHFYPIISPKGGTGLSGSLFGHLPAELVEMLMVLTFKGDPKSGLFSTCKSLQLTSDLEFVHGCQDSMLRSLVFRQNIPLEMISEWIMAASISMVSNSKDPAAIIPKAARMLAMFLLHSYRDTRAVEAKNRVKDLSAAEVPDHLLHHFDSHDHVRKLLGQIGQQLPQYH